MRWNNLFAAALLASDAGTRIHRISSYHLILHGSFDFCMALSLCNDFPAYAASGSPGKRKQPRPTIAVSRYRAKFVME